MLKVIFCTVRNYTSSLWLNNKLLQLTHTCQEWWADRKHQTIIVDSYTDLNQYLDQADWLVVQTAGDISLEQTHLMNKLINIPDDVGFIGHLVWYEEDVTPHLHPQCFIIRTNAVKELKFDATKELPGVSFTKSKEDMHQGHAPLEIFLDCPQHSINYGVGTAIFEQVLSNGYRVTNFDFDWRFGVTDADRIFPEIFSVSTILKKAGIPSLPSRGYCFPEIDTEQFEQSLRSLTPNNSLDPSQQIIVELFRNILEFTNNSAVSILHWDHGPNITSADKVISTAGGFLGESIALRTNAKHIVFYDINIHTVEFKKSLYTEWNGQDYFAYANTWAKARGLTTEPKSSTSQQNANNRNTQDIIDNWAYFKTLTVEFMHCDIVKDPNQIAKCISSNSVIHTSNILGYYFPSAISYSQEELDNARSIIGNTVTTTNSKWSEI